MTSRSWQLSPCEKPAGWLGRAVLWLMNARHSKVTDWGLSHITVEKNATILDVGCGGGRTVSKLAAIAIDGKVYGVDYSKAAVDFASRTNRQWIANDRVEIREGSVSGLPFLENMFDLVTAVETHFWWPDLPKGTRETLRVLKPGGRLVVIAEMYRAANPLKIRLTQRNLSSPGMKLLSLDEHRDLLTDAGYVGVQIAPELRKGWICAIGSKPLLSTAVDGHRGP